MNPIRLLLSLWGKPHNCTPVPDLDAHECCEAHDHAYSTHTNPDGSPTTRAAADLELYRCMRNPKRSLLTRNILAPIAWATVRALGWLHW